MVKKSDLDDWVHDALSELGGHGTIVDVCKHIWKHHERELRDSGELFYTWQYDMRWAADHLRGAEIMKPATASPRGIWELSKLKPRK